MEESAWAAKLRAASTVLTDHAAAAGCLAEARFDTDFKTRAKIWAAWYNSSFACIVNRAVSKATPLRVWPGAQRECYEAIRTHSSRCASVELRFRQKLSRWGLAVPIGTLSRRAPVIFTRLKMLAPPRVVAAIFRTQWNGWCTARRFQQEGTCCLGCSQNARDCIEHYAACPRVRSLKVRFLGLRDISLDSFLCLRNTSDAELSLTALATYATFRATQHFRGKPAPSAQQCADALEQWCKTGASGHRILAATFDQRWLQRV